MKRSKMHFRDSSPVLERLARENEYIFDAGKLRSSLSMVETVNGVIKNIPVSAEEYVRHQSLQMYRNSADFFLNGNTLEYWIGILGIPNLGLG